MFFLDDEVWINSCSSYGRIIAKAGALISVILDDGTILDVWEDEID